MTADEPPSISNRIRGEAAISTRPGQFDRLNAIADEVAMLERLVAAIDRGRIGEWESGAT